MKKTALFLGLAVVMSFFVVGCILQQSKTIPVYYTFPGAVGQANSYIGQSVVVKSQASPLTDGQSIQLGNTSVTVIATPGHSPGSICLSAGDLLFSGDTLFKGSVGRTDFPDSSAKELQLSLHKLDKLPANTRVLPGHGDATTLGNEGRGIR